MAYQVRKLPDRITVGNDALDRRDDWRTRSREPSNCHSEFIRPMYPRIEDDVESQLIGKSQLIFPPTRPGDSDRFDAVLDDGICRLIAANGRPTSPGVTKT